MKIGVVGLGYVGLVTAGVLAYQGHHVVGMDILKEKIEVLKNRKLPIYEPGLAEILFSDKSKISFTDSYEDLKDRDIVFVAVPTPTINNKIDLSYVINASKSIASVNKDATLVIRSTVIPGTARKIMELTGLNVISNPEFTREGSAVYDTLHPDRVVVGGKNAVIIADIWKFTNAPMIITTNEIAELIKYASNSFLAVKISFINEFAKLCEKIPGCDIEVVAKGIGLDKRIGESFLKAGLGFGGSCLPKDTRAIVSFAESLGVELKVVKAAIEVNDMRIKDAMEMIRETAVNKDVCVLGVAFKDNTDDIRESRALLLIKELIRTGYSVSYYDPVVKIEIENAHRYDKAEECIKNHENIIIATEWPIFKEYEKLLENKVVIDLRRVLDPRNIRIYRGVGLGPKS